ncbi:MAG: hypothetical protein VB835_13365, partial [Pirellulales bacterium]
TYSLSKRRDMKRRQALILLVGLLLVATPVLAEPTPNEVIAAIKKLGGGVSVDQNKAVVRVSLYRTNITDAGLANLKGLSSLEVLYLYGTQVTDAGVEKLKQALPKCMILH